MSVEVDVQEFGGDPSRWDDYVATCPDANFSHQYQWMQLIREVYGGQPHYLAAIADGEMVGVLPMMLRRVIGEGRVLFAPPFADEGGCCPESEDVEASLIDAAISAGAEVGANYLELRQRHPVSDDLPCDETRATLEMPLTEESETLWDDLSKNMRKKIRRARRDGLECQEAGEQLVPAFYDIYARNMQEIGSPMHGLRFFEALFDQFGDDVLSMVVRHTEDEAVVGAAVAIRFRETLTVLCAHSLRDYFDLYPNNLLYWHLFEAGIDRGCTVANFGRSPRDSGIYRFKKSWHMEDHQLYYTKVPICGQPTLDDGRESASYSAFRKIWPRVPGPIARAIGPRLWARLPI